MFSTEGHWVRCQVIGSVGQMVWAAHFGARVLKTRRTGEGGTPKRLKIWLVQGANIDEMD